MKVQYKRIYAPFEQTQSNGNTQLVGWAEQSDAQITEIFFLGLKSCWGSKAFPNLVSTNSIWDFMQQYSIGLFGQRALRVLSAFLG